MSLNDLSLARELTSIVLRNCKDVEIENSQILQKVSPITAELLKFWFSKECCDSRSINFHEGQKQAILNIIYAHEVLKTSSLKELYEKVIPSALFEDESLTYFKDMKNHHPKYCFKMATGTGKTWVLQAIIIWQILNATFSKHTDFFTKNFLIIAPGLIVYERLVDAFLGKEIEFKRDFNTSDLYKYQELFLPDNYKHNILQFIQSNVCLKDDIGNKTTSEGLIAITNKHALKVEEEQDVKINEYDAPGLDLNTSEVIKCFLPISPGASINNDLQTLDKKFGKSGILNFLSNLNDLIVFNDEAHHIHTFKKEGTYFEVEWQKSLNIISQNKLNKFIQIDFSATPYTQSGSGNLIKKSYFPHIISDFNLNLALQKGFVKSLVLDKRKEIGSIPNDELNFKSEKDEHGNIKLSEGQIIMLRAGLVKLQKLEDDFRKIDTDKHPKMLIVCEDTLVTPIVEDFFISEGLKNEDVLRIDSNKKGEVTEDEWKKIKENLFNIDNSKTPKIIISVLMLREGFDVNNICVIVPLRASKAPILLEQTLGRGLRLMWRESDYEDLKKENRNKIQSHVAPSSLIDVLIIIEHPAFIKFYEELEKEGLISFLNNEKNGSSISDIISVPLKENYEKFDFEIPFISNEIDDEFIQNEIDISLLKPFNAFSFEQIKNYTKKDDIFYSTEIKTKTTFGDYRVRGGIMTADGYNDYLIKLVNRISILLSEPITKSNKIFANKSQFPFFQINKEILAEALDNYIRSQLFNKDFDPMIDENWRCLLIPPVINHISSELTRSLLKLEENESLTKYEIFLKKLSEAKKMIMRETYSIEVQKSIYERLKFPSKNGGFEKLFMEVIDKDVTVEKFCKIDEYKHSFLKLRYINEEGIPRYYHPDFLVKIENSIFLVETKAQNQIHHKDVERKKKAAYFWCKKINSLPLNQKMYVNWHYVLLGQSTFDLWISKGASVKDLLNFATVKVQEFDQSHLMDHITI
jgi:type III restriction enzyme